MKEENTKEEEIKSEYLESFAAIFRTNEGLGNALLDPRQHSKNFPAPVAKIIEKARGQINTLTKQKNLTLDIFESMCESLGKQIRERLQLEIQNSPSNQPKLKE